MAADNPLQDKEPSPDFDAECRAVYDQWKAGDLPFDQAAEQLRGLKRQAADGDQLANEARADFLLGVMQGYRAHLNLAIQHFEQARTLFSQLANNRRVLSCDLNLGETYRQKGDFSRARQLFDQAYQEAKVQDNLRLMTIALANKGQTLFSQKQVSAAREVLNEALQLHDEWVASDDNPPLTGILTEVHHVLALTALNHDDPQTAWEHAKHAFQQAQEDIQPRHLGFANRTMAEVLTALGGQTPEADRDAFPLDIDSYFQAALQAFREIDAEGEVARTTFAQARSLAARGRRVQAARRLQEAMIAFSHLGMVDDATRAAELQTEIF